MLIGQPHENQPLGMQPRLRHAPQFRKQPGAAASRSWATRQLQLWGPVAVRGQGATGPMELIAQIATSATAASERACSTWSETCVPRRARLQRGSRLTPSRGGKRVGRLPTTGGFAATWERRRRERPPARRSLRARAPDRKSKIAAGRGERTAKGGWTGPMSMSLSRSHVEVECLLAAPPFCRPRRHHTRRWLNMGGSEA